MGCLPADWPHRRGQPALASAAAGRDWPRSRCLNACSLSYSLFVKSTTLHTLHLRFKFNLCILYTFLIFETKISVFTSGERPFQALHLLAPSLRLNSLLSTLVHPCVTIYYYIIRRLLIGTWYDIISGARLKCLLRANQISNSFTNALTFNFNKWN